jgi:hypothetical protein
MAMYCGFLSPAKQRLLEDAVYRHNGDSEKNGDANHMERNVSVVTEGGPADKFYRK